MAEGASNMYSQLSETVAKVKQQQDQHQKALEIITRQLTQFTQFYEAAKEIRAVLSTRSFDSNNREESMMANEEGQEWEDPSQKNKNGKHSESSEKGKTSSNKKTKKWPEEHPTNVQTKKHPTNSGQRNISPESENLNETEKEVEEGTPVKKRNIDGNKRKRNSDENHNYNSPTSSTPKIDEKHKERSRKKKTLKKVETEANPDDISSDSE